MTAPGGRRGSRALAAALGERRVLVVCGAGGVGKTTTAAALALQAALEGRHVLVCTIDPARRLATSLGLAALGGRPRPLDLSPLGPRGHGALWAMMLDTRRTFDALVERHAPGETARRRILDNRFYRQVSSALAGSHEYMAMEKLLELSADDRFDLVVLDTPPTRHALDFLEAPERLMGFLDTSVLRWFLKPYFVAGRLTLKVATRTGAFALDLADRVLGLQFLQDLSEFFLAFEGMYAGFKQRAEKVHALLRGEDSGFVLVAGPARTTLDEALYFYRRLREKDMPFVGLVVNRVHPDPLAEAGPVPRGAAGVDAALARALLRLMEDQARVARRERRGIARLEDEVSEPLVLVPELEADVHDLRGLKEVGELLLSGGRSPSRRRRPSQLQAQGRG
ncbi:MAG: gliding motility protein [Acidobacteria bacterium]|nr:MAG: gliding motility protein [Acidobacteriota bacterium]PYQ25364.1 MAG: gliding motility protein [Acidobacteriota bacterium]